METTIKTLINLKNGGETEMERTFDIEEFHKFLKLAKQNAWTPDAEVKKDDNLRRVDFTSEDYPGYLYWDEYHGDITFVGNEVIMYYGKVVWKNSYAGIEMELLDDHPDGKYLLGLALMEAPIKYSYRGPREIDYNDYKYTCMSMRLRDDYITGTDTIIRKSDNRPIFTLSYGGSLIRTYDDGITTGDASVKK